MRWAACLVLAGCTSAGPSTDDTDGAGDTDAVAGCPAAGTTSTLADGFDGVTDGFNRGTEGVAFAADGTLYVVNSDQLVRVALDGTKVVVAETPGGVGATWWNGAVWVASWDGAGALFEVTPAGVVTRHETPGIPKPNFLLPTAWGTLLVSDDFDNDFLYEFTAAGDVSTWATDVPSPNGMGFSPDGATLYVVSTFVNDPPLSAIVVADKKAGARTVLHSFASGEAPDGLLVTSDGTVLVAVNLRGRIDAWRDGAITTVAQDLDTPASMAAGVAPFDPCLLVVTSLFGETVSQVSIGPDGL